MDLVPQIRYHRANECNTEYNKKRAHTHTNTRGGGGGCLIGLHELRIRIVLFCSFFFRE